MHTQCNKNVNNKHTGSHMVNESCQTNCTCCVTLGCAHTYMVACIGGFVIHEVFKERVHMLNWLEVCMVTINGVFNVSAISKCQSTQNIGTG